MGPRFLCSSYKAISNILHIMQNAQGHVTLTHVPSAVSLATRLHQTAVS